MKRQFTQRLFRSAIAVLLVGMAACNRAVPPATTQPAVEAPEQNNERRLILENASLEQADSEGQVLWKIKTKRAIYSRDRRKAELEDLSGDLYQDGELVLKITADRGKFTAMASKFI
ncbi:MAG: LPS export ABC transporter periplasmic protein LptC [Chloroflexaceae bacterium]|nr:LPS export ABC transporter periplasmic protein LptC [Chloroflexaceae bacterium]